MTPIKRRLTYVFKGTMLRLFVSWENRKKSITLSTGYNVDRVDSKGKSKWDGSRCLSKSYHGKDKIPAAIINKVLENLEESVDKAFYSFEIEDKVPSPSELKTRVRTPEKTDTIDFVKAYNEFILEGAKKHQWAENTIKSIKMVMNLVVKFRPQISLADIDRQFFDDFIEFQKHMKLSNSRFKNGQKGYSNAVIKKNCRVFKWFLRWAKESGYIDIDVPKTISVNVKTIVKPVIFLTWEELMRVYNYDFDPGSEIDRARDFFCFCCFTSLRYSDAAALRPEQIINDKISLSTIKTDQPLLIELNKYSKSILEKYKGKYATVLPSVTNNRLNHLIKEIGEKAGINQQIVFSQYYGSNKVEVNEPKYKLLTTHCGRRTFICNALALGISPITVMKWTGHSEYSAMKPYIDVADPIREEAMTRFNER